MMKHTMTLLMTILFVGCSFAKQPTQSQGQAINVPQEDEWQVKIDTKKDGIEVLLKELPDARIQKMRALYVAPEMRQVSPRVQSRFEIYQLKGLRDSENILFVQPKVFVSTASNYGSVIGYRPNGSKKAIISIPVALVNGFVDAIPTVGGSLEGAGSAVSLPPKYRMSERAAIEAETGKALQTLPVCPSAFILRHAGKELVAESPFRNHSNCPVNQFFRVEFEGPESVLTEFLEAAALREESVSFIVEMVFAVELPRKIVQLTIDSGLFESKIRDAVGSAGSITVEEAENYVTDALLASARSAGMESWYSSDLNSLTKQLLANYFERSEGCAGGDFCKRVRNRSLQRGPVRVTWRETEPLMTPILTRSVVGLGPSANVSTFEVKPSLKVIAGAEKPIELRGLSDETVRGLCAGIVAKDTEDGQSVELRQYCVAVKESSRLEASDGYSMLGSNTQVFPGAWLRLDIRSIEEFTSAKTTTRSDGTVEVASEVINLRDGGSNSGIKCVEGSAVACEEYQTRQELMRSPNGDPLTVMVNCREGDEGCACTETEVNGQIKKTCQKAVRQFHNVRDFSCAQEDEWPYCPYYRTQQVEVSQETEYDCETVMTEKSVPFLCIGGCKETYERICKLKKSTPVFHTRQVPNCQGFDPELRSALPPVIGCKNPRYLCKKWSTNCKRYSIDEALHIVHEEHYQRWRPMGIERGEYPKRFLEDIYLKFQGPKRTVSGCKLSSFERFVRGNSLFIKIPSIGDKHKPCDEEIWDSNNTNYLDLPIVWVKSLVSNVEERLCGRTEVVITADELPMTMNEKIIPSQFEYRTSVRMEPIQALCKHPGAYRVGQDLWFIESAPVRISGTVSVLGKALESISTRVMQ